MRGALALVLWAGSPSIPPTPDALTWDAPLPGCPTPAAIGERLATRLGARTLAVEASARVRPAGAALRLDLRVAWPGGVDTRTLEADTCESLAEATVVLVALMAEAPRDPEDLGPQPDTALVPDVAPAGLAAPDTLTTTTPVESPPPTATTPEPSHTALAPEPSPAPPATPRTRARGFALSLLGLLDVGSLRGASGGLGLTLTWRWPRLRLFAAGAYLPPRSLRSDAAYATHGRVQLGLVQLGACLRLGPTRLEVPLCGALEAGGSRAAGFGLLADRGARDPWLALAAGPALVVALSRVLALVVRVEAVVPLLRTRYIYGSEAVLHQTAPVAVRAGLGLEFRIPDPIRRQPENHGVRVPGRPPV